MSVPFTALVPAAGSGLRFGEERKQWIAVGGRPVLGWTVERLLEAGAEEVVVAVPAENEDDATSLFGDDSRVRLVAGGDTRQASVRRCLEATPGPLHDLILVHDGVRPAVAIYDLFATVAAAEEGAAAVLGRPVEDTLKEVREGAIVRTVDRTGLYRVETPQVFRRELLERAMATAEAAGFVGTDEASLVERLDGVEIRIVEATAPNPKLTRPDQLPFVRSLLER